jgi:hypothetical protein
MKNVKKVLLYLYDCKVYVTKVGLGPVTTHMLLPDVSSACTYLVVQATTW